MPPTIDQQPAAADRDLINAALAARKAGTTPTARQAEALRRWEKTREEADRWRFYATIPKKHWRTLSGRQYKVLDDHAVRYGAPTNGATVDLAAFVKWHYDFMVRNAAKLSVDLSDPLMEGDDSKSPALQRYHSERAKLAKLDRLERENTLIDRAVSHECWARTAGILRRFGETLQRQFGPAALRLFNQALTDADREVNSVFAPKPEIPQPSYMDSVPPQEEPRS